MRKRAQYSAATVMHDDMVAFYLHQYMEQQVMDTPAREGEDFCVWKEK
jgi:hypothetical protein